MMNKKEFIEAVIEVLYEDDECPLEVSASMACEIGETLYQKLVEKEPKWQDEWPKEKGLWWFHGWRFGKEGLLGKEREPELCLVNVSGPLGSGGFAYVTNGHFLYAGEGAVGRWQKAVLPESPKIGL